MPDTAGTAGELEHAVPFAGGSADHRLCDRRTPGVDIFRVRAPRWRSRDPRSREVPVALDSSASIEPPDRLSTPRVMRSDNADSI